MRAVYTAFILFVSALLVAVFHPGQVAKIWETNLHNLNDRYYQVSFLGQQHRSLTNNLSQLGGRVISSDSQQVQMLLSPPLGVTVYLRPILAQQNLLKDQRQQVRSYKSLHTISLKPLNSKLKRLVFDVNTHLPQRLSLGGSAELGPFQLELSRSESGQRVIGGLEIMYVTAPANSAYPPWAILLLMTGAPLIWLWLWAALLPIALALAVAVCVLVALHLLSIVAFPLAHLLVLALTLTSVLLLLLKAWVERRAVAVTPMLMACMLLAAYLRWEEILKHATVPIRLQPMAESYYTQALRMQLFSPTGFFSGTATHDPLFPLLLKLTGHVFGFSPFHMFYLSWFFSLTLVAGVFFLSRRWLNSSYWALLAALAVALNPLLIEEAARRQPSGLLGCIFLCLLVLLPKIEAWGVWGGGLLGAVCVVWVWTQAASAPFLLLSLCAYLVYALMRKQYRLLRPLLISVVVFMSASASHLYPSYREQNTPWVGASHYLSWAANQEFADTPGYPASTDLAWLGTRAPGYQTVTPEVYLTRLHSPVSLMPMALLGYLAMGLDAAGAMTGIATGQNSLLTLIDGMAGAYNFLGILLLFVFEVWILVTLCVYVVLHRKYWRIALFALLLILPYSIFYGLFMYKGWINSILLHDLTVFVAIIPILAIIGVDVVRSLWLRLHAWAPSA
jgi:hypothetical protein